MSVALAHALELADASPLIHEAGIPDLSTRANHAIAAPTSVHGEEVALDVLRTVAPVLQHRLEDLPRRAITVTGV